MAGIEPASERIDPRISTSVVDLDFRQVAQDQQKRQSASHLNPKALFRINHGSSYGTPAFWRPLPHRQENGRGRRGFSRKPLVLILAYAARGRAAY